MCIIQEKCYFLCGALHEKYHWLYNQFMGFPYTFGSARYGGISFSFL